MILGIDISTSKIGISIIDENENLLLSELIKMKPSDPLETRAEIFKKKIEQIRRKYEIKHIFVEQPYMAFSGGKTTAVTMAKLQRFKACLLCIYVIWPVFPYKQIKQRTCRTQIKRGENTKLKVIEWVQEKYQKILS